MNDELAPQEKTPQDNSGDKDGSSQRQQDERGEGGNSSRSRPRKDALEDLSDLIVERATNAHPTLRTVLAGTVEVFIRDRPFRVLFDFTSNPPKRLAAGAKESDCTIEADERTFFRIHQGELNPQLAMVSDKIVIKGKSGLAVYFFNLLGD